MAKNPIPYDSNPRTYLTNDTTLDTQNFWSASKEAARDSYNERRNAEYQAQLQYQQWLNTQSFQGQMKDAIAAGLNPNFLYAKAGQNGNPGSISAPEVHSRHNGLFDRLTSALSVLNQVINTSGAVYQQEAMREQANQAAIKTMSDQFDLDVKAYSAGDVALAHPYDPSVNVRPRFGRGLFSGLFGRTVRSRAAPGDVPSYNPEATPEIITYQRAALDAQLAKFRLPALDYQDAFNQFNWYWNGDSVANLDRDIKRSILDQYQEQLRQLRTFGPWERTMGIVGQGVSSLGGLVSDVTGLGRLGVFGSKYQRRLSDAYKGFRR